MPFIVHYFFPLMTQPTTVVRKDMHAFELSSASVMEKSL